MLWLRAVPISIFGSGCLDAEANLTITGRRREMINRGGELLAPTLLENMLQRHPNVPMGGTK